MRVVLLTSGERGLAPYCAARLAADPAVDIAMIVLNEGRQAGAWKARRRTLRKVRQIGPLGAVNGVRMRSWFDMSPLLDAPPLAELAAELGVPLARTPTIGSPRTVELFARADADLGLSLGNPYIPQRVFAAPRLGMINIHHEVLPAFQGAQSVIWQIHEGSTETGYTIHRVERKIDGGEILYQERLPIRMMPTLADTVRVTVRRLHEQSAAGLLTLLRNFDEHAERATRQQGGRTFTTPTFGQYRHMVRQHRRLRAASAQ